MRNAFFWGLVFSIVVHLIIGAVVAGYRPPRFDETDRTNVIVAHIRPIVIHTATPTPIPTVRPAVIPSPRERAKLPQPQAKAKPLRLNVPKTKAVSVNSPTERTYVPPPRGSESGVPGGTGNASAGAASGAGSGGTGAACPNPFVKAHVLHAIVPDYPPAAENAHAYGTTLVLVTLAASGNVTSVNIAQSSGNAALDNEALRAARESDYAPDIVDCRPVGGSYIFRAIFEPN